MVSVLSVMPLPRLPYRCRRRSRGNMASFRERCYYRPSHSSTFLRILDNHAWLVFIPLPSVLVRVEHGESALLVISLVSSLQFAFEGAVFELAEFHGLKPYRYSGSFQ